MARSSLIIISGNPKGVFTTGILNDTSVPGTLCKVTAATAMVGGLFTYAAYTGTDGMKAVIYILLNNNKYGQSSTAAGVAGEIREFYTPAPGEDVNILVGETAGTGNTYAIGDRLILEGTSPAGTVFLETGSPQDTPFICMEAFTQQASSRLTWCRKT
jgi:hypothetical protein